MSREKLACPTTTRNDPSLTLTNRELGPPAVNVPRYVTPFSPHAKCDNGPCRSRRKRQTPVQTKTVLLHTARFQWYVQSQRQWHEPVRLPFEIQWKPMEAYEFFICESRRRHLAPPLPINTAFLPFTLKTGTHTWSRARLFFPPSSSPPQKKKHRRRSRINNDINDQVGLRLPAAMRRRTPRRAPPFSRRS